MLQQAKPRELIGGSDADEDELIYSSSSTTTVIVLADSKRLLRLASLQNKLSCTVPLKRFLDRSRVCKLMRLKKDLGTDPFNSL